MTNTTYDLPLVGLSFIITLTAFYTALALAGPVKSGLGHTGYLWLLRSALIIGITISGVHYVGLPAVNFFESEGLGAIVCDAFNWDLLATLVGMVTLVILGLALITTLLDQRLAAVGAHSKTLKESEKHLGMLIREMHIGVLLLSPDLEILLNNQAAIDLLGLTDSQLQAQATLSQNLLFFREDGAPFTQESWPMQQAIATRQSVCNVVMGVYRSLSSLPLWLQVNAAPQLAADGSVERIVCTFSNITPVKQAEAQLRQSEAREREKAQQLKLALCELKQAQAQLIQTEKMSSLGQLVAGVAHEINNPVNFIYGNLVHAKCYTHDLLDLVHLYSQYYPNPVPEIQQRCEEIDVDFLCEDLPKLLDSMKVGADRVLQIVFSLKHFSRHDEAEMKRVDIHSGIDSTLLILQNQLKATGMHQAIEVVKEYGDFPAIECYPGQLNQVFMNIISNAIDALEEERKKDSRSSLCANGRSPCLRIRTSYQGGTTKNGRETTDSILIQIIDNGSGITEAVKARLFDPFFTTKPVGKGTGLGLSISYQIVVEKHKGTLECSSKPGQGTEFRIKIPVQQNGQQSADRSLFNNVKFSFSNEVARVPATRF